MKNKMILPLVALGFDFLPVLIIFLTSYGLGFTPLVLLSIILSPIAGLITGIEALRQGKGQMGIIGKTIAITAIALPISLVAFVLIIFAGLSTGIISLM